MKIFLYLYLLMLFINSIQAQTKTPSMDSLLKVPRDDEMMTYTFSDKKNKNDSITNGANVIVCQRILTKEEINILRKYNISDQIYGFYDVDEDNLEDVVISFPNIILLSVNTHKNRYSRLKYLKNLKNLKYLLIYSEENTFIPDDLFSLLNLEKIGIRLYGKKIKLDNLYKFSMMPNLNSLSLEIASESKNFDISQFEKLKNIKCLSIGFNSNLVLSDNFHTLDNLIFLEISGDKSSLEKNIETLVKMKNLKYMQIYIRDWDDLGIPNNLHKLGFLKELRISLLSSKYDKLKPDSNERFKFKTFLYEKQAEIREMFPNTSIGFCFY